MSEEREVMHLPQMGGSQTIGITEAKEIADNQEELSEAELEARVTRVLERGIIIDRCTVTLPDGVYGEWVNHDPAEVARMEVMGFELDNKYATDRASNADGTGISKIGDVVFMTCPQRVKDMIEKVRAKRYADANPVVGKQREEKGFEAKIDSALPVIDEGTVSAVNAEEIDDVLTSKK